MHGAPPFIIRPLVTHAELAACVEMQRDTWGREFSDVVPPTILKVSQRLGGVTAGAFDDGGALLGFVFGMTGVHRGRVVHWSDMLAVRPGLRDQGVGRALKRYQAGVVRALGAEVMYWTFDPLQARNANFNLMKLGVDIEEYVEDMYGVTDSDLHRGLGTDRFIAAWQFDAAAERAADAEGARAPLLNPDAPEVPRDVHRILAARPPVVRVQIPLDIGAVQRRSLDEAHQWRLCTRAAFVPALDAGYAITGFARDAAEGSPSSSEPPRGYYLLRAEARR
jgi:predicted GNAT superfamily acetyltransferase